MTEVSSRFGSWTFDGDHVRIVPGRDRRVHKLRQSLGELNVPLLAIAGAAFEPARKGGRLRLRLREGADPLSQIAGGRLEDAADPFQLTVEQDRTGVAEFFADEVRNSLTIEQVPEGPTDRYLLPGPALPVTVTVSEGTVMFDGRKVRLEWGWQASEAKQQAGPQELALDKIVGVDWKPESGLNDGLLRFRVRAMADQAPENDPRSLRMSWGTQNETMLALAAAAVAARLPHPSAPVEELEDAEPSPPGDPDTLLRQLRELGELHKSGVLSEDEFNAAKQALLKRF